LTGAKDAKQVTWISLGFHLAHLGTLIHFDSRLDPDNPTIWCKSWRLVKALDGFGMFWHGA
jgi:hypothetical protein